MPIVRVRFNHKFKCSNTKKNLNDMKIKDEKEVKKIPTLSNFLKIIMEYNFILQIKMIEVN